jgi:amidohydrolase
MQENILENLLQLVEEATPWAISLRREFHRWPELGNEEYRTIQRIKTELNSMGIPTKQLIKTGLVGMIEGETKDKVGSEPSAKEQDRRRRVIALRADIDALPIQEKVRLPFSSERDNHMHACGHDVHAAVLLGTARVLSKFKNNIDGTIKFIFQPAEETTGGAERMVVAGCLKEPEVDSVFGFHVKPELMAGKVGIQYGRVHASSDMFRVRVKGMATHCAYPDRGVDALVTACQIVNSLQAIISRAVNPLDPAVISVGSLHSGNAVNIIADEAMLEGTIRTFDSNTREYLRNRVKEVVEYTAKAAGGSAEVEFYPGYDALINDDQKVDYVKSIAINSLGSDNVVEIKHPSMGVEDFTYYLKKTPGAFFFVGSGFLIETIRLSILITFM